MRGLLGPTTSHKHRTGSVSASHEVRSSSGLLMAMGNILLEHWADLSLGGCIKIGSTGARADGS